MNKVIKQLSVITILAIVNSGCVSNDQLADILNPYSSTEEKQSVNVNDSIKTKENEEIVEESIATNETKEDEMFVEDNIIEEEMIPFSDTEIENVTINEFINEFKNSKIYTIDEVILQKGFSPYPIRIIEKESKMPVFGLVKIEKQDYVFKEDPNKMVWSNVELAMKVTLGIPIAFYSAQNSDKIKTTQKMTFDGKMIRNFNGDCKSFIQQYYLQYDVKNRGNQEITYKNGVFYKNGQPVKHKTVNMKGIESSMKTSCIQAPHSLFSFM